jgi:hypothetical protein
MSNDFAVLNIRFSMSMVLAVFLTFTTHFLDVKSVHATLSLDSTLKKALSEACQKRKTYEKNQNNMLFAATD